ncbi:hypothetical protein AAVH_14577 [Aphelenchoides avenae]|nr:hypothetical protein AAVH_14577 [Aphelenchus avenae]
MGLASITLTDSTNGFYAVVVFQCARRFVWYELGWRYYQAYATTSDYVIRFEQSSPWDNNCGAIVFFP